MDERQVTVHEIERARRAIEAAPKTELGLILPPHVLEERARAEREVAQPKPNRAQRRAMEKAQKRGSRRATPSPPAVPETAQAALRELGALPEAEREQVLRAALDAQAGEA